MTECSNRWMATFSRFNSAAAMAPFVTKCSGMFWAAGQRALLVDGGKVRWCVSLLLENAVSQQSWLWLVLGLVGSVLGCRKNCVSGDIRHSSAGKRLLMCARNLDFNPLSGLCYRIPRLDTYIALIFSANFAFPNVVLLELMGKLRTEKLINQGADPVSCVFTPVYFYFASAVLGARRRF